jgi:hypothetical protein
METQNISSQQSSAGKAGSPCGGMIVAASFLLIALATNSCSYSEKVSRRSQLANPIETGAISVMTTQKSIYKLGNYKVMDSTIVGTGFLDDGKRTIPFTGEIQFSDIAYVQVQKSSFWLGLVRVGAVAVLGATAIGSFDGKDGLSITPVVTHHYGGSSCPFIYGWNGADYILEGEAFATAWGQALEMNTCTVLPSLKERKGELSVRITNERPETHYINAVNLVAVETDADAEVCADPQNTLWPVYSTIPPVRAHGQIRDDILTTLRRKDGKCWESESVPETGETQYRDVVDVVFLKPPSQEEATLVIHAINTRIFDAVMRTVSQSMGDELLAFVDAVEHDPEMIALLKHWLEESSLKASLWNGSGWEPIGTLLPEANEIPFSRVIRFNARAITGDSVKIRLTSLADVWKFDAVGIDWSPVHPLTTRPVPLISARGPNGKDLAETLTHADDQYAVVLPPEKVDITFQSLQACAKGVRPPSVGLVSAFGGHPGKKTVYALNVQGYLHEWFPESRDQSQFMLVNQMKRETKIAFLKNLLKHESIFLPLLYSEWRQQIEKRN